MSHLIKIYAVCYFSYFRLWYQKSNDLFSLVATKDPFGLYLGTKIKKKTINVSHYSVTVVKIDFHISYSNLLHMHNYKHLCT